MTVMTLQTAGANRIIDNDPARAYEALKTVEEAEHRAMGELRRPLSYLRMEQVDVILTLASAASSASPNETEKSWLNSLTTSRTPRPGTSSS